MTELDLFTTAGDGLDASHFGLTDEGRGYVVAGALAKALQHSNSRKMLQIVDDDERGVTECSTPGGTQTVNIVYEEGIWRLIFRSNLPSARTLTKRVTAILRQLRETGVVDTRPAEKPMSELEMAERYVHALKRLEITGPKAEAYDSFMTAEGDYPVGTVAQMLGTGQNRLFAQLRDEHIFITGGKRHNTPYQQYLKHFRVVTNSFTDNDGAEKASHTTFVRPSGVDFIRKVLKLQQIGRPA
jgi:prophage antirepressor-like protein